MTKHINACKILIILPICQSFILALILDYNTNNYLYLLSDNFEEDTSLRTSNNSKEKIWLADIISNNNKNSGLINID